MVIVTEVRACLKAIEEGCFNCIDISAFTEKFLENPFTIGDHLQFVLQKFCKENEEKGQKGHETAVVKLSRLCFSKQSTAGFNNLDRFLGSLFHISTYLLNRKIYTVALEISKSIEFKKKEIENASKENQSTRDFLYILHSRFITSAGGIATEVIHDNDNKKIEIAHLLASQSLKFLNLIKLKQLELGRKLFRNFRTYFSNIRFYSSCIIHDLYKNLEVTLTNLMPKYKNQDFLLYYLMKIDQFDELIKMNVTELNNYFKRHLHIIMAFLEDSKNQKYWNFILDVLFGDLKESSKKNLSDTIQKLGLHRDHKFYFLIIQIILNVACALWTKEHADDLSAVISERFINMLFSDVICVVRNHLGNSSIFCRLSECCIEICFGNYFALNLLKIIHLIRLYIKRGPPDSLDLMSVSREAFKLLTESLTQLKNTCCLSRKKQYWENMVLHYTNTIEGLLRHSSPKAWILIRDCCEELVQEIIISEFDLPFEWKRLAILFQRWHYANMKLNNYDEALFVTAFYVSSFPKDEDEALSMWVQTKMNICEETPRLVTFKDIIDKKEERMRSLNPKWKYPDTTKLLLKELIAYSSANNFEKYETKKELILKLWNILKKLNLEPWERATALSHAIFAMVASADSESLKKYKKECEEEIKIIMKTKRKKDYRNTLYAGNLKYALFLCNLRFIQDSEEKMNRSSMVLEHLKKEEEEKIKFGDVADLNLSCNVMPSSNHFMVTFEETYLTALNETFQLWEEAAATVSANSLERYEFDSWLHSINQISRLYHLIGDHQQSYSSWFLYYRVAKLCDNRPCILLGLSHIVTECSDIKSSALISEAEGITHELSTTNKEKEVLISYWLVMASKSLKNGSIAECYDYLCKIKESTSALMSTAKSYVIHAKYWCLVSKFLCLHHDYKENFGLRSDTELKTVAFKAFKYINSSIKDGLTGTLEPGEHCDILLTMLDVNTWASRVYGFYYQTAFIRLFLDDMYQLFQRLVLPTRTAQVLTMLAEVDIMCEKLEEGTVKLNSLKGILGPTFLHVEEDPPMTKKSNLLEVPPKPEEERGSPRDLSPARFLDIKDSARECDVSPMKFVISEANPSKNIRHSEKCTCYICRNLLIRVLNVNALMLEAELYKMRGSMRKSFLHYSEGYDQQKRLECYRLELTDSLFSSLSKYIENFDFQLDFQSDFVLRNSVKFLIRYAFFLLSPKLKNDFGRDVGKLILKIDKLMPQLEYDKKLLQWTFAELKLINLVMSEMKNKDKEEKKVVSKSPIMRPCDPIVPKTPMVSKFPKGNAAPMKQKQSITEKSPNFFASRRNGCRIFEKDEENVKGERSLRSAAKKESPATKIPKPASRG